MQRRRRVRLTFVYVYVCIAILTHVYIISHASYARAITATIVIGLRRNFYLGTLLSQNIFKTLSS